MLKAKSTFWKLPAVLLLAVVSAPWAETAAAAVAPQIIKPACRCTPSVVGFSHSCVGCTVTWTWSGSFGECDPPTCSFGVQPCRVVIKYTQNCPPTPPFLQRAIRRIECGATSGVTVNCFTSGQLNWTAICNNCGQ